MLETAQRYEAQIAPEGLLRPNDVCAAFEHFYDQTNRHKEVAKTNITTACFVISHQVLTLLKDLVRITGTKPEPTVSEKIIPFQVDRAEKEFKMRVALAREAYGRPSSPIENKTSRPIELIINHLEVDLRLILKQPTASSLNNFLLSLSEIKSELASSYQPLETLFAMNVLNPITDIIKSIASDDLDLAGEALTQVNLPETLIRPEEIAVAAAIQSKLHGVSPEIQQIASTLWGPLSKAA